MCVCVCVHVCVCVCVCVYVCVCKSNINPTSLDHLSTNTLLTKDYNICTYPLYTYYHCHCTGGTYTTDILARDDDGFYNTITYSLENDYNGTFVIDSNTGALRRTSDESLPAPAAVCNKFLLLFK